VEGEQAGCVDADFDWEAPAEVGGAARGMEGRAWAFCLVASVIVVLVMSI
jgi:hypothetical protein